MKKGLKTCLIISLFILFSISCASFSALLGYILGTSQQSEEKITEKETIIEKQVYYEKEGAERYFDEDSNKKEFQKLLSDAEDHFTFTYEVQNQKDFEKDRDFILANLEHQYSRLSILFQTETSVKITVILTDDLEQFKEDLNLDTESGIVPYSAFAIGNDKIEIYINPLFTADKFDIAHTISHELVHIFQSQVNTYISLFHPDWFIEGMAESFAFPSEEVLIHGSIYKEVPDLDMLDSVIRSPQAENYLVGYDASHMFFLYLLDKYGEDKMIQLVQVESNFETNFTRIVGIAADDAYATWLKTL